MGQPAAIRSSPCLPVPPLSERMGMLVQHRQALKEHKMKLDENIEFLKSCDIIEADIRKIEQTGKLYEN